MNDLDPALVHLAEAQHGMLTTQQFRAAGLSAPDLVALVSRGTLAHPGRGLYAVADLVSKDPIEYHRQLVAGAFLLYPDAVLTGVSGLLAHGLPVWNSDLTKPQLLRDRDRSGGMKAFKIRRTVGRSEAVDSPWGPCVPLAEALAQHAIDAGIVQGVVSLDAALKSGQVTDSDLEEVLDRVAQWPGSSRVGAMVSLADGRRESVGESRTGVVLSFLGIEVVPQVEIHDEGGYLVARVDFLIKGTKVIIEFDGKIKYADDDGTALFAEKKREDRLRSLGYVVVRIVWADLERPHLIAAKVRQAMAIAA